MKIEAAMSLALMALACWDGTAAAQSRAEFNYQRLLNGQVQWPSMTPEERQEIIDLDRMLRSTPADNRGQSQRCWREELEKNGSSHLSRKLIELRCGKPPEESKIVEEATPSTRG